MSMFTDLIHATITKVHGSKSRVDIKLDNGDEFKECVLGLPLGTREKKEGKIQVCKGTHVLCFKGYGGDWIVAFEDSQRNKPNDKVKNEILFEDILKAVEALADGLSKGGESTCVNGSPLTNAPNMISKALEAKQLAKKVRKERYNC